MLIFFIIGLAFYALTTVSVILAFIGKREAFYFSSKACALVAFCALTVILFSAFAKLASNGIGGLSQDFYFLNFAFFLSVFALSAWYKFKSHFFLTLISPLLFLLLHNAMLGRNDLALADTNLVGFLLVGHIAFLTFALACLLVAGIAALLFIMQERALKKKKSSLLKKNAISLESLDKINIYATEIGFPFYTLGLACGFLWASIAWESTFSGDIKEIISIIVWLGYALLFYMRLILKLSGKKPAYLLLILCALSLFSLLGVNVFFDTHHNL